MLMENRVVPIAALVAAVCGLGFSASVASAQVDRREALVDRFNLERDGPAEGLGSSSQSSNESLLLSNDPGRLTISPAAPPPPYKLSFTTGAGYNSNPGTSPDGSGGALSYTGIKSSYKWLLDKDEKMSIELGYQPELTFYEGGLNELNQIEQTWSATFGYDTKKGRKVALKVSDYLAHINGSPFQNRLEIKPSLTQGVINEDMSVELAYAFRSIEYTFAPSDPVRDPDSNRHIPSISLVVQPGTAMPELKEWFTKLTATYRFTYSDADGADLDYRGQEVGISAEGIRFWKCKALTFDLGYTHFWNDYGNSNSQLDSGRHRHDQIDQLDVKMKWKLWEKRTVNPTLLVWYKFAFQQSNLSSKQYDQNFIFGGVTLDF